MIEQIQADGTALYAVGGAVVTMGGFIAYIVRRMMDRADINHTDAMSRIDTSQKTLATAVDSLKAAVESLNDRDAQANGVRAALANEQRNILDRQQQVLAAIEKIATQQTSIFGMVNAIHGKLHT